MNRLKRTPTDATSESCYQQIVVDFAAVERWRVKVFVAAHAKPPEKIILDLDATDDPLDGNQEGRFFHGDDRNDLAEGYPYKELFVTVYETLRRAVAFPLRC